MSTLKVRRQLAFFAGLLAAAGLLVVLSPLGYIAAARADVTAGDLVLRQQDSQGYSHIVYRKSDGTETTLTLFSKDSAEFPDVSANGSRIAFDDSLYTYNSSGQAIGGGDGIWVMNSDGTDQTQLTFPNVASATSNYADSAPRWSPDGTKLAFDRANSGDRHIYGMNADGTGVTDLTPNATVDQWPAWSPNGSQIAYIADDANGIGQVWVMNADGSNPHAVDPSSACSAWYMDWASNNRIYAWRSCSGYMYLSYLTSTDNFASSAGSTETDITPPSGTGSLGPVFVAGLRASGDGNTLYFAMGGGSTVYDYTYTAQSGWTQNQITTNESDWWSTPVKATWPNANTKTIVGLGDSVAAGEGINYGFIWTGTKWKPTGPSNPPWMDTTAALGANYQDCHQSGRGYSNLVTLNGDNYEVYNMACTGASALQNNGLENGGVLDREIFNDGTSPPAQLGGTCTDCDSPSPVFNAHSPDIVLLTLGADDINFANWVSQCYAPGPSCNTPTNTATLHSQLRLEKTDLTTVFAQLNRWAAGKHKVLRVLITNYYNPIDPNNTGCRDYRGPAGVGIVSGERTWIEKGLATLNSNIAADIITAQSKDLHLSVSLVDLSSLFQNGTPANPGSHAWCTSDPWAYGPSIDYSVKGLFLGFNPAPFHPTPEGQDAIYQAVNAVLNSPA